MNLRTDSTYKSFTATALEIINYSLKSAQKGKACADPASVLLELIFQNQGEKNHVEQFHTPEPASQNVTPAGHDPRIRLADGS